LSSDFAGIGRASNAIDQSEGIEILSLVRNPSSPEKHSGKDQQTQRSAEAYDGRQYREHLADNIL
jgi:hypothetical protein